tara:strand:+ start:397 stop:1170 length:774 start_codon:yes stop_codon:yes gene_type:complete
MDEFLKYEDLQKQTIKRHLNTINKLDQYKINPLTKEETIITKLKQQTPITQQTLTKTILKIRSYNGLDNTLLNKYNKKIKDIYTYQLRMDKKSIDLPDINDVKKKIDELYYIDTKAFIINKLLITYAFRNRDLKLQVINNKNIIEPDKNYIIIMKTRLKILIQDYKTKDVYGIKSIINTDKDLYKAVVDYYEEFGDKFLLSSNNISRELSKIIVYGLNETELFRLLIHSSKNLQEAKKYGETRGTGLNTIEQHYTSI